jgi:alpha-beta hydrolase superfamily lysophospholipase
MKTREEPKMGAEQSKIVSLYDSMLQVCENIATAIDRDFFHAVGEGGRIDLLSKTNEGCWQTSGPADLIIFLKKYLELAKQSGHEMLYVRVMEVVGRNVEQYAAHMLTEFKDLIARIRKEDEDATKAGTAASKLNRMASKDIILSPRLAEIELEFMCALVNDASKLLSEMDSVQEEAGDLFEGNEIVQTSFEDAASACADLGHCVIGEILRDIFNDLREPFNKIFSSHEWSGEGNGGMMNLNSTIFMTLDDYLQDLSVCMNEFFLEKLLVRTLARFIAWYCSSLFGSRKTTFKSGLLMTPDKIVRIKIDSANVKSFFGRFSPLLKQGSIDSRLAIFGEMRQLFEIPFDNADDFAGYCAGSLVNTHPSVHEESLRSFIYTCVSMRVDSREQKDCVLAQVDLRLKENDDIKRSMGSSSKKEQLQDTISVVFPEVTSTTGAKAMNMMKATGNNYNKLVKATSNFLKMDDAGDGISMATEEAAAEGAARDLGLVLSPRDAITEVGCVNGKWIVDHRVVVFEEGPIRFSLDSNEQVAVIREFVNPEGKDHPHHSELCKLDPGMQVVVINDMDVRSRSTDDTRDILDLATYPIELVFEINVLEVRFTEGSIGLIIQEGRSIGPDRPSRVMVVDFDRGRSGDLCMQAENCGLMCPGMILLEVDGINLRDASARRVQEVVSKSRRPTTIQFMHPYLDPSEWFVVIPGSSSASIDEKAPITLSFSTAKTMSKNAIAMPKGRAMLSSLTTVAATKEEHSCMKNSKPDTSLQNRLACMSDKESSKIIASSLVAEAFMPPPRTSDRLHGMNEKFQSLKVSTMNMKFSTPMTLKGLSNMNAGGEESSGSNESSPPTVMGDKGGSSSNLRQKMIESQLKISNMSIDNSIKGGKEMTDTFMKKIPFRRTRFEELCRNLVQPLKMEYDVMELGPSTIEFDSKTFQRDDTHISNFDGNTLACSHWQPSRGGRIKQQLPCLVYLHSIGGCRKEVMNLLSKTLLQQITIFAFDFSGSGQSGGDVSTYGFNEQKDVDVVVRHLKSTGGVSDIFVWGRGTGASAALLYMAAQAEIEQRSPKRKSVITGAILDSPFVSLDAHLKKVLEMSDHGKISAISFRSLRSQIKSKARFDIVSVKPLQAAQKCTAPVKFLRAKEDQLVDSRQCAELFDRYAGTTKSIHLDIEGDHSTPRPHEMNAKCIEFLSSLLVGCRTQDLKGRLLE